MQWQVSLEEDIDQHTHHLQEMHFKYTNLGRRAGGAPWKLEQAHQADSTVVVSLFASDKTDSDSGVHNAKKTILFLVILLLIHKT